MKAVREEVGTDARRKIRWLCASNWSPANRGRRDSTSIVRTSMTAGILSRVTADLIQFDGMTTGGSSGSPVFNADGEVISVRLGL